MPRTTEQLDRVVRERPDNWEYLYFGGVLLAGVVRLQGKFRDQETQYVRPGTRHMNDREVALFLGGELDTLRSIVGNVNRIFNEPVLTAAFGAPGSPGDPERIAHLADSVVAVAEQLLDYSAGVRSIVVSSRAQPMMLALASIANQPLADILAFIDRCVEAFDDIPSEPQSDGEPHQLTLVLRPTLDQAVCDRVLAEQRRLGGLSN